jgi:hypothetical protein
MKSTESKKKSGDSADETGLREEAGYRPHETCHRAGEALQEMSEALQRTGKIG